MTNPPPSVPTSSAAATAAPLIYSLSIERYRGIEALKWQPAKGVNVILGGGDVGKTTILEAIALLLTPTNAMSVSDTDYYLKDVDAGFVIEAVFSLPSETGISNQLKPSWPWQWNGKEAVVPNVGGEAGTGEPVYRLRVRGTDELELAYEIVQPDGAADMLPVSLRRAIGLVRLAGDDRSDRDLRLVQGSRSTACSPTRRCAQRLRQSLRMPTSKISCPRTQRRRWRSSTKPSRKKNFRMVWSFPLQAAPARPSPR